MEDISSRSPESRFNGRLTADEIIELRQALGLSQEQLAQLLSASSKSIFRWEQGNSPSGAYLRRLRNLYTVVHNGEWRKAMLSILDSKGIPTAAGILDALDAVFMIQDPYICQKLVRTVLNIEREH